MWNKLINGENIVISDVTFLPPEASTDREKIQLDGIQSLLGVPFYSPKGDLLGFMGFDDTEKCRNWAAEDIRAMRIVAEMIGTYLERMHTEKLLEESEYKYSNLVEQALDAIVIVENWVLKFINKAGLEMTGYTAEEGIGMPFLNLIAPEAKEKLIKIHTDRISGNHQAPLFYESKIKRKDGSVRDVDMFIGNITYNGKLATMGIVRDITERKRMERELQKMQKLEGVGMLAGGIAHDFNNLLTAIIGNLSLVELYKESGNDITSLLKEIKKASHKAKNITQRLITFAKGGAPVKKAVSVSNLLNNIAYLSLSGSNVKYELSISDDLWWSELDEGQMNQAMGNLIINADQAMPRGGIIKLSAENVNITKEDRQPLNDGKYLKIKIVDRGTGIPKEYIQKIFDPYFTTKPKASGLGLAITYSIVNKHGGYITVKSEVGVGSTFIVYLPAVQKEIFTVEKVIEEELHTGKGHILLMGDQQGIRDTAGKMLSYLGYEVEFAKNGAETIELYKSKKDAGEGFDVVILDLTIPAGVGGKEAIVKLHQINPEIKAIVSSGYSNNPVITDYRKYGFSGVVSKPYEVKELSDVIYRVISGKEDLCSKIIKNEF